MDFSALRYFQKAIFGTLALPGTNLESLEPLSELAVMTLDIRRTQVKSLAPLYNSSIYNLLVDDTPISDFSPLKGHKINILSIRNTPINSLKSLKNIDIRHLDIAGSPISEPNLEYIKHIPSLVLPSSWRKYVEEGTFGPGTKVVWAKEIVRDEIETVRVRIKHSI